MTFNENSSCQRKPTTSENICDDIISNAIKNSELNKLRHVTQSNDSVMMQIGEMSGLEDSKCDFYLLCNPA